MPHTPFSVAYLIRRVKYIFLNSLMESLYGLDEDVNDDYLDLFCREIIL